MQVLVKSRGALGIVISLLPGPAPSAIPGRGTRESRSSQSPALMSSRGEPLSLGALAVHVPDSWLLDYQHALAQLALPRVDARTPTLQAPPMGCSGGSERVCQATEGIFPTLFDLPAVHLRCILLDSLYCSRAAAVHGGRQQWGHCARPGHQDRSAPGGALSDEQRHRRQVLGLAVCEGVPPPWGAQSQSNSKFYPWIVTLHQSMPNFITTSHVHHQNGSDW